MEGNIKKTIKSLEKRQIKGWVAKNALKAQEIVAGLISPTAIVGIGDSSTLRQVGIVDAIKAKGNRVINPFDKSKEMPHDTQSNFETLTMPSIEATICDVFLTGTNALTEDGRIVNVDGAGNRVAGMFWGHPVSILVVGRNKIVKNLEAAMDRVKNVVCPEHLKRKGMSSPCIKSGRCHDCTGTTRVCAITTIIERKPVLTEINVVIVDMDLGLSWDRSWPKERIDCIVNLHEEFMWGCPIPRLAVENINAEELWNMVRARGISLWGPEKKQE
jgi:hypothetical protein